MEIYDVGDKVKVFTTFYVNGRPTDPTDISVEITDPLGNRTIFVYGIDAEVKTGGEGSFFMYVYPDKSGDWYYNWIGTGAVHTAEEEGFNVKRRLNT
jgi:hypothetical protein